MQCFVNRPTQAVFDELKKADLLQAARILEIPVISTSRKADIKNVISRFFVKTNVWSDTVVDEGDSGESTASHDLKLMKAKLRLKELELRTKQVELEIQIVDRKIRELDMVLAHKGSVNDTPVSQGRKDSPGFPHSCQMGAPVDRVVGPCFYCKKPGHRLCDCLLLKQKREKEGLNSSKALPDALVKRQAEDPMCVVQDKFEPSMSTGSVGLSSDREQKPVTILQDKGAS